MYDTIIIGKGPAGATAAIYLARAGKKVLVIANGFGALEKADKIGNYYGFPEPVTGIHLLEEGVRHASSLGAEFLDEEVTSIDYAEAFSVKTANQCHASKTVILATGLSRKKPSLEGLSSYEGRGVSYCAVCDAFFYRKKTACVIGSSDYALEEALELLPFTGQVTILTNGREFKSAKHLADSLPEGIAIDTRKIHSLAGEEKLEELIMEDGSKLKLDGLFVAEGSASAADLAFKLGIMTDGKAIITDNMQKTNIPGFFAAGDCTGGTLQIGVAVGEGTKAALSAIEFLRTK